MKVSLSMIVRGSTRPDALELTLRSIVPFVDELCVIETHTVHKDHGTGLKELASKVCDEFDCPIDWRIWVDEHGNKEMDWISDFSEARNQADRLCTGDLIAWIDSDTVLVNGDLWRKALESDFANPMAAMMQVNYQYQFDEQGRCDRDVATTMVYRNGYVRWKWPIHEQPIMQAPHQGVMVDAKSAPFYIRHEKTKDEHDHSTARNKWLIEKYMERGGEMDSRMWNSWATCMMFDKDYPSAVYALERCLALGTDRTERYLALSRLGGVLSEMGRNEAALEAFYHMVQMFPQRSHPWVYIADVYARLGQWENVLAAVKRSEDIKTGAEGSTSNPKYIATSPLIASAKALANLHRDEDAIQVAGQILEQDPGNRVATAIVDDCSNRIRAQKLYESYAIVAETDPSVWAGAPDMLNMMEEVAQAKLPGWIGDHGGQLVAIYCGPSAGGQWHGDDLEEKGLGGSEEAVTLMSRQLTDLGYKVVVFAMPPLDKCGADEYGVVWAPSAAYRDTRNWHFIQWRGANMIGQAKNARSRWVWLHDVVQRPEGFTPDLCEELDGIFCLTEFHAKPLMGTPAESKVVYTKNGIDPSYYVEERERDRTFAYYSSPDRGLDLLLNWWPEIRERIPGATLDIYYGFTDFYLKAMKRNPQLAQLRALVLRLVDEYKDQGVTMHGMVNQRELAESMARTKFWLYPTSWPETSCVTAMKAQAMGCYPITSRYKESGVPETCKYDLGPEPHDGEIRNDPAWRREFVDRVVEVATMPEGELPFTRQEMAEWARTTYDWRQVASQWSELFSAAGKPAAVPSSPS